MKVTGYLFFQDVQQEEQVTSTQIDFSAGFNEIKCSQAESQSSRKKPSMLDKNFEAIVQIPCCKILHI